MNLKLDENLGERGAEMFRAAGHDVATVPGQNLTSAPDSHWRRPHTAPTSSAMVVGGGGCLMSPKSTTIDAMKANGDER